ASLPKGSALRALAAIALALATSSYAASRGRYGGTLRVAVSAERVESDPLLADSPADAALISMTTQPICRLQAPHQPQPPLAADISRSGETQLAVVIPPGRKFANGAAITAKEVTSSWSRATQPGTPYRALLFPIRDEGRRLSAGASQRSIELPL